MYNHKTLTQVIEEMKVKMTPRQIRLYTQMKQIYAEYSGDEIAASIGFIRSEIEEEKLWAELETKFQDTVKAMILARKNKTKIEVTE
ncbi:MAG TPA: hypothetical protein VFM18_11825 [Methanosarcina sp.]|nr:hypothetical protein [Methanosarcina sp.]